MREQYIRFCKNSFSRDDKEILEDLEKLIAQPEITHIAFCENEGSLDLLLGTTHVYITDKHSLKTHDIGKFIIRLNHVKMTIKFTNISSPLQNYGMDGTDTYHHPHVNESGHMCISAGKNELMEKIAEGDISSAVEILVRALWTVDAFPYTKLEYWPIKKEVDNVTT